MKFRTKQSYKTLKSEAKRSILGFIYFQEATEKVLQPRKGAGKNGQLFCSFWK